jgi:hypothetical protein
MIDQTRLDQPVNLFDAGAARRRELAELVEETDGADAKGRLAYLDGKSGNDNPYLESGGWSQQPEAAYEWHESFLDEMKLSAALSQERGGMMAFYPGHFARIWRTSTPLMILAIDGDDVWLKDDEGYKRTEKLDNLELVPLRDGRAHLAACDAVKRASVPA